MLDWDLMFGGVQALTRYAPTLNEGIRQTLIFAREHPEEYDDPDFWDRLEERLHRLPYFEVTQWAREGLEALTPSEGWDFLLLDLGDCPEIFTPYQLGCHRLFEEAHFRDLVLAQTVFDYSNIQECLGRSVENPQQALYYENDIVGLTYHNVSELGDASLTWNIESCNYRGSNGELLWLSFGSFALLEPLREREYCRSVLKNRDRLYLLAGFEEMFSYLATLTPDGLKFEEYSPIDLHSLRSAQRMEGERSNAQLFLWSEEGESP